MSSNVSNAEQAAERPLQRLKSSRSAQPRLVSCKDGKLYGANGGGKLLRLEPLGSSLRLPFLRFLKEVPKDQVIMYFRDIVEELEDERGLIDFHMKVLSRGSFLTVEVFYGDSNPGPPDVPEGSCISCNLSAPIFEGMTSGETVLPEYGNPKLVRCSLDAQGRPMFVVTPVRHIERCSAMSDEELYDMWQTTAKLLQNEGLQYQSMILNHGSYRHLPHLHLKVRVTENSFEASKQKWSAERLAAYDKLKKLCPPETRMCKFFFEKGNCPFREKCRFSHVKA